MYRVVCSLEQIGGLKCEYDVGTFDDLPNAKTALSEWLKPYGLHVYQIEDLWLSITKFYCLYIRGNETYHAIAFIHIEGEA